MPALEVIAGRALNPGAGPTALGPNTGDSFQVRSTPNDSGPSLWGIWSQNATGGLIRVRSPRMHDAIQGIRFTTPPGALRNMLPDEAYTPMYSQDLLTFEIGGGGAETDVGCLLMYYPDLGGVNARLATYAQVLAQAAELATIEVAVTAPATAGDWSAGTAVNATNDLLKANADYAILGYTTSVPCAAVGIRGTDTGNLRVGGPGTTEQIETRDWFASLSETHGVGTIPILNQANRGNTLVHVCPATAVAVTVDLIVMRLNGQFGS